MNRPIALAYAIAGLSAAIAIITVATTLERPVPPVETSFSVPPEVVYVDEAGRPLLDPPVRRNLDDEEREEHREHGHRDHDDDHSERDDD